MAETKDKLTLTVRKDVARKARALGRRRKQSVSRMFEEWVLRMSDTEDPLLALAGLWKDREITLEDLRAKAWSRS
ncbi:MAG: hypothetical protein KF905_06845 [Flavobacteriales bacterium]|nr:hypothetical protein [Flavobacteriales bacterium]